jgi:chromosome segregation ATPase
MSGSNSGRSWFEGTLDVISGSMNAPRSSTPNRSSTPVRNSQSIHRSSSAPNSPARNSNNNQSIERLPSKDSLDRSIHNDSGHGKSVAQIIRDLKQANSRLTARTASLEADFMNQLNQTTMQFETKQKTLEDTLKQKEKHVANTESRCKMAEARIREKDEGLTKLKEESAFQRHSISDLKRQLHQLSQEVEADAETNHGRRDYDSNAGSSAAAAAAATDWKAENQSLVQELETLQKETARHEEEKRVMRAALDKLKKQRVVEQARAERSARSMPDPETGDAISFSPSLKQLEKTQNALDESESALATLQSEQELLVAEHAKLIVEVKEELKSSRAGWEKKEGDLLSKISILEESSELPDDEAGSQSLERDTIIAKLRDQVLDYSSQLTELTEKLVKAKANNASQEQYRRDEADDLRVLNDAQEEEIDALSKQLEDALKEIDMRGQELEEERERVVDTKSAASSDRDEADLEESSQRLTSLQGRLDDSNGALEKLQQALLETKQEHERRVASLSVEHDETVKEKNELLAKLESQHDETVKEKNELLAKLESQPIHQSDDLIKKEKKITEEYEEQISILKNQKEMVENEYESRLMAQEMELAELRQTSAAGEPTADSARVKTDQSGGSLEEDLRKELDTAKMSGKRVSAELNAAIEKKETEMVELQQKLEDRDTTISALVKSSVSLEQQIDSSKSVIDDLHSRISQLGRGEGSDVVLDRPLVSETNAETEELIESLAEAKAVDERSLHEVSRLKRQVHHAMKENTKLRAQLRGEDKVKNGTLAMHEKNTLEKDDEKKTGDGFESHQQELKERDEAISNLVNQSMEKERQLAALQAKLSTVSKQLESLRSDQKNGPLTSEEVKALRDEAEMFAGQVIEQDEEIETLKNALQARDTRVVAIQKELNQIKSKPVQEKVDASQVQDLEAEIDELKEANSVQTAELRVLRKTARDFESATDKIAQAQRKEAVARKDVEEYQTMADDLAREKTALVKDLDKFKSSTRTSSDRVKEIEASEQSSVDKIARLEAELKEQERLMKNLETAASAPISGSNIDEMEMEALKEEKKSFERNLASQSAAIDTARNTIRDLERMLAQKTSEEACALEEEKEELLAEIETLTTEVENLKHQNTIMEEERALIEVFKEKLVQADVEREESEKTIVDTFERKISLLTLDKDVTIDKIRKELIEEKEENAEEREHMSHQIEEFETEIRDLKEEMSAQLDQREQTIHALEHTLHAQEQLVGNMRSEMDHLQGSMVSTASGRRQEIEDMQQELVDLTSRTAAQEREITSLRMQLEEKNLEHQTEVAKLTETISSLESNEDVASHRTAAELQMDIRVREVKERLEKLRWRNETLQEENVTLRQRLEKAEDALVSPNTEEAALRLRLEKAEFAVNSSMTSDAEAAELRDALLEEKMRVKQLETELRISVHANKYSVKTTSPSSKTSSSSKKPPVAPVPASPSRRSDSAKRSVSGSSPNRRLGFLGRGPRRATPEDLDF